MSRGVRVHDLVEGLTHVCYDDIRMRCGLWFTLYPKGSHTFTNTTGHVTCLPCIAFEQVPHDKPLWRNWP